VEWRIFITLQNTLCDLQNRGTARHHAVVSEIPTSELRAIGASSAPVPVGSRSIRKLFRARSRLRGDHH
jgi:hypothetical protein